MITSGTVFIAVLSLYHSGEYSGVAFSLLVGTICRPPTPVVIAPSLPSLSARNVGRARAGRAGRRSGRAGRGGAPALTQIEVAAQGAGVNRSFVCVTLLAAALLGIVQGITEFLPVSSTAHLLLIGRAIGYQDPGGVFTVMIQLGSILALSGFTA